jgi:hypothetical protein
MARKIPTDAGNSPPSLVRDSSIRSVPTRGLYVAIVMVMSGIVLAGFWPFYAAIPGGGTGAHWVLYLHAAVFSGWMLLLFAQVVLVFRRKVRAHQGLGKLAIYYGLLVLLLGLAVTVTEPARQVMTGTATLDEAAGFLLLPLGDMLLFAGFFGAGIVFRREKELHKRLMVLATIALLFAPAARIGADISHLTVLAVWLLPLAMAIAHDAVTRHRLEPVYVVGAVVLLAAFARVDLMASESWLVIGRPLLLHFVH